MQRSNSVKVPVKFKLDGREVTPQTVDLRALLDLAGAYFRLVAGVAKHQGAPGVDLVGIEVAGGSCLLNSVADEADVLNLRSAAGMSASYLGGTADIPRAVGPLVRAMAEAQRAFSADESADFFVGEQSFPVMSRDVPLLGEDVGALVSSSESLRCEVKRVGGEHGPNVRLTSRSEARAFTLSVNKAQAVELGKWLYRDVDVEMTVRRTLAGNIVGGTLNDFQKLEHDADPLAAMNEWFAPQKSYWESVGDIESELRNKSG